IREFAELGPEVAHDRAEAAAQSIAIGIGGRALAAPLLRDRGAIVHETHVMTQLVGERVDIAIPAAAGAIASLRHRRIGVAARLRNRRAVVTANPTHA